MKLVWMYVSACVFAVLLSNSLARATSNGLNHTNILDDEFINFDDLDIDMLYKISKTNERGYRIANEVFWRNYRHIRIEIGYVSHPSKLLSIVSCNVVYVDPAIAADFLRAFAKSIQKLSITYHFVPKDKRNLIGSIVNHHCSEYLVKFRVRGCPDGAFDSMRKPFEKVEKLDIEGNCTPLRDDALAFDQLFPNIRALNVSAIDGHSFDQHYPHLTDLNIKQPTSHELAKLLENNPQIHTLHIQETTMDFLDLVNRTLPNLRVFAFNTPNDCKTYQGPRIYFDQVREIAMNNANNQFKSDKFIFKHLENLKLFVEGNMNLEWVEFIGNSRQLKTLDIAEGFFKKPALQRLTQITKFLTKASINLDMEDLLHDMWHVKQFVASNSDLQELILTPKQFSPNPDDSKLFQYRLLQQLQDEWNVVPLNDHYSTSFNITRKETLPFMDVSDLDIKQLLNLTYSNQRGFEIANEIFAQKYGQVEIGYVPFHSKDVPVERHGLLYIDPELTSHFLKGFAKSIQKLSIAYVFVSTEMRSTIGKIVNDHCLESLVEFHVRDCPAGAFDDMRKPFEKVEIVNLDGNFVTPGTNALGVDQLFPEMRVLNVSFTDGYIFHRKYPKLIELNAKGTSNEFSKILENNPQIKTLRVQGTTMEFLDLLSQTLPELTVFSFNTPKDCKSYQGASVDFDQVKEVSMNDVNNQFKIGQFNFKHLNKLELIVNGNMDLDWVEFIGNSRNLTTLTVSEGYFRTPALEKLSEMMKSLTKASINYDAEEVLYNLWHVKNLLANNSEMIELILTPTPKLLPENHELFYNRLVEELKEDWNVAHLDKHSRTVFKITKNISSTEENMNAPEIKPDESNQNEKVDENGLSRALIVSVALGAVAIIVGILFLSIRFCRTKSVVVEVS